MTLYCRGVRGATTCEVNEPAAILDATRDLLQAIIRANEIAAEDVAGVFFTVTSDLDAAYPAKAARELGWSEVALMCANEIPVPDGLPRCIRILVLWNTGRTQHELNHVYLRGARVLRPDLIGGA